MEYAKVMEVKEYAKVRGFMSVEYYFEAYFYLVLAVNSD
jgi:hypothetical protein